MTIMPRKTAILSVFIQGVRCIPELQKLEIANCDFKRGRRCPEQFTSEED